MKVLSLMLCFLLAPAVHLGTSGVAVKTTKLEGEDAVSDFAADSENFPGDKLPFAKLAKLLVALALPQEKLKEIAEVAATELIAAGHGIARELADSCLAADFDANCNLFIRDYADVEHAAHTLNKALAERVTETPLVATDYLRVVTALIDALPARTKSVLQLVYSSAQKAEAATLLKRILGDSCRYIEGGAELRTYIDGSDASLATLYTESLTAFELIKDKEIDIPSTDEYYRRAGLFLRYYVFAGNPKARTVLFPKLNIEIQLMCAGFTDIAGTKKVGSSRTDVRLSVNDEELKCGEEKVKWKDISAIENGKNCFTVTATATFELCFADVALKNYVYKVFEVQMIRAQQDLPHFDDE